MKNLILTLLLAVVGVSAAHANTRPATTNGAVLGAVAGALIGGHNNDRWAQGAVIGAVAGTIIGAAIDDSRPAPCPPPVRVVSPPPGCPHCAQPASCGQPTQVVYVTTPPPRTRVVYVDSCPPPVLVTRPVVYVAVDRNNDRHRHSRDHRRW